MTTPLDAITTFYLESDRFNGYPFRNLEQDLQMSFDDAYAFVRDNVEAGDLTVVFGDIHPNPHIKAFTDEPMNTTLVKLESNKSSLAGICLYPTKQRLETFVNPEDYRDRPYTYEMALGAGQLEYLYFDLIVLEFYKNDPRYYYRCDDINGQISIHDEYYHDQIAEQDQILLETFGFAYDDNLNRAVTTPVWYISQLTPEHQQVWKYRELNSDEYWPHPDYHRNNMGYWGEKLPICTAFLMEQKIINQMCDAMEKPHLFRQEFDEQLL